MEDQKLLPGQRFCPMEDELLVHYLKPMVNGDKVPGKGSLIHEYDLYGDQEPWHIWKQFESRYVNDLRKNHDMYFFTQKKKLNAKASRVYRKVGTGSWKGQAKAKPVYLLDQNGQPTTTLLGHKTLYTYYISNLNTMAVGNNDEQPKQKGYHEEEVLLIQENCAGNAAADCQPTPTSVLEEPQLKRQCLPLSAAANAAPLLIADVEHGYDNQKEQPNEPIPAWLTAAGPKASVDEPAVAVQGSEHLAVQQPATEAEQWKHFQTATEPHKREEPLTEQCQDTFGANGIISGLDNWEQQMGDFVGKDWCIEDLFNDAQINSLEAGDWNDGPFDFSEFRL